MTQHPGAGKFCRSRIAARSPPIAPLAPRNVVNDPKWPGPAYGTCANAGLVASKFEFSRRRENLSFTHHNEVCGLPPETQDALIDRCRSWSYPNPRAPIALPAPSWRAGEPPEAMLLAVRRTKAAGEEGHFFSF